MTSQKHHFDTMWLQFWRFSEKPAKTRCHGSVVGHQPPAGSEGPWGRSPRTGVALWWGHGEISPEYCYRYCGILYGKCCISYWVGYVMFGFGWIFWWIISENEKTYIQRVTAFLPAELFERWIKSLLRLLVRVSFPIMPCELYQIDPDSGPTWSYHLLESIGEFSFPGSDAPGLERRHQVAVRSSGADVFPALGTPKTTWIH